MDNVSTNLKSIMIYHLMLGWRFPNREFNLCGYAQAAISHSILQYLCLLCSG